uniref:glycosyltransferase n=1 Tax=Mesotoga sp. TaxID=2053577 RepID=UPI00345EE091
HFQPNGDVLDYSAHFEREGKNVVLYVGRFGRYKGLDYLLKAMNLLDDKYHLVLVGDGPERDNLLSLIETLELEERVTVMPHVSYSTLPEVYRSADVFALPSTDRGEAFGRVALEAMACGVPVITTELGTGTTYHNLHGITGYHVPPEDERALAKAIERCADENMKEKNAALIRKRAEEFSIEKFRISWEELILSLTEKDIGSETR